MFNSVQIHNRPLFYATLISSLRNAVGIEKVDLVISSDYWSQEMNSITEAIDFCRVHQVSNFKTLSQKLVTNFIPIFCLISIVLINFYTLALDRVKNIFVKNSVLFEIRFDTSHSVFPLSSQINN